MKDQLYVGNLPLLSPHLESPGPHEPESLMGGSTHDHPLCFQALELYVILC